MRVVAAVPHAREGYTAAHTPIQWAGARFFATHFKDGSERPPDQRPKLVGVATDSCGVQLAALIAHGTPTKTEADQGVRWIGLDDTDYALVGKVGGGYGESPLPGTWGHKEYL